MQIPVDLIDLVLSADHVVALTGAGVSAESGIPTFRDAMTGLWAMYQAEELATPEAFRRNPSLVWNWYQWRKQLVLEKSPNAGHVAIKELSDIVSRFSLITQNVDGLHQKAGSRNVIELHGNIRRSICFDNRHLQEEAEGAGLMDVDFDIESNHEPPPECPQCGSMLRPDVIWFGEALNPGYLNAASEAAMTCEVFFSIGTSSLVHPAASLAEFAKHSGARIVEVNPNPTPLTPIVDYALHGAGGEVLPELVSRLQAANGQG
ncbi:MAG: NAD-dependent deacylase [Planctomycetota bacterium]